MHNIEKRRREIREALVEKDELKELARQIEVLNMVIKCLDARVTLVEMATYEKGA